MHYVKNKRFPSPIPAENASILQYAKTIDFKMENALISCDFIEKPRFSILSSCEKHKNRL